MKAKYKLAVANAVLIAGIAFLASLPVHMPASLYEAITNLYAAGIGAGLAFLFQLKPILEKEAAIEEHEEEKSCGTDKGCKKKGRKRYIGMLIA